MSLHCFVKSEMFMHAGATTALSEKETPEFISTQLWSPNSPDLNPVDYSVLRILQVLQEKVYKFIPETIYQVSSQLPEFCRRYYKKRFGLFFCGHSIYTVSQKNVPP